MISLTPRCSRCGKFTFHGSDSSTPFGGHRDFDPPDPEYYCGPCALQLEDEAVRRGQVPINWAPANWEQRAAKRLRHAWKPFDERLCLDRVGVSVCLEDKGHSPPHKKYNSRGKLMIEWEDFGQGEEVEFVVAGTITGRYVAEDKEAKS